METMAAEVGVLCGEIQGLVVNMITLEIKTKKDGTKTLTAEKTEGESIKKIKAYGLTDKEVWAALKPFSE